MNTDLISRKNLQIEISKQIAYFHDRANTTSIYDDQLAYNLKAVGLELARNLIDNATAVTSKVEFVTKNGITFPKALEMMTYSHELTTEERQNIEKAYMLGVYTNERQQGEWIPVSERLPEDMQRVLIWFEYYRYGDFNCMYQTYGFGYTCDGKWSPFINGETGWQDYRVIAWQPLPEPYL